MSSPTTSNGGIKTDVSQLQAGAFASGSPKSMYMFFLLSLCSAYFETITTGSKTEQELENATVALIAFMPDDNEREKLFRYYEEMRKEVNQSIVTASVLTVGKVVSYLNVALEFTEKSYGGII